MTDTFSVLYWCVCGSIEGKRPRLLPISLPPNSLHLSTPATQTMFSIFFFAKGGATRVDGENNIIIKWKRSLKKAMYMYSTRQHNQLKYLIISKFFESLLVSYDG